MKIAVLSPGFPPAVRAGGPARTLEAMIGSANSRFDISVITNNFDHGTTDRLMNVSDKWICNERYKVAYIDRGLLSTLKMVLLLLREGADCVYLNSLFSTRMSVTIQGLFIMGIVRRVVIAPRGELDPGALASRGLKKSIFVRTISLLGLPGRVIWHASSPLEEQNIKKSFGDNVSVVVRENDTLLPEIAMSVDRDEGSTLRVVFVGRISPKKGLHILLQAAREVRHDIVIDIYGPEEDHEYASTCHDIAAKLPKNVEVNFKGLLNHDSVRAVFNQYDVFAFPTAGENFAHVIAEALSSSCPVMVPDVTPWTSRLNDGGGIIVADRSPSTWAGELNKYARGGSRVWREKRSLSAECYTLWRHEEKGPHLFELLEKLNI